jgi:hypothetical protein
VIVVAGSRHDPVAAALVRAWPGAALCAAEDLAAPGWIGRLHPPSSLRWIVAGRPVADSEISGVFVRRSAFYPEEFLSTHPDDRAYLAAEAHAFLGWVLSRTGAVVANRPRDGAFGKEALGLEQWMPAARRAGVAVRPLRLTSRPARRPRNRPPFVVDLVGGAPCGDAPVGVKKAAARLAGELDLVWATALFDGRRRLIAMTAAADPGPEARDRLGAILARRPLP